MLNEGIIDFFEKYNVELTLSIDGPERIHDKGRRTATGGGTLKTVLNNLRMIKENHKLYYDKHLKVNAVVTPYDKEHYQDLLKFFDDPIFDFVKKQNHLSINNANYSEAFDEFQYLHYIRIFNDKITQSVRKFEASELYTKEHLIFNSYNSKWYKMIHFKSNLRLDQYSFFWPNGICIPGMRSLFVSSEGEFYPCEKLYDTQDMKIGNINSGFDVNKIEYYVNEYKNLMEPHCKHCWAYRFCGECFLDIYENGKFNLANRLERCKHYKQFLFSILKNYIALLDKDSTTFDFFRITDVGNSAYTYVNKMIDD